MILHSKATIKKWNFHFSLQGNPPIQDSHLRIYVVLIFPDGPCARKLEHCNQTLQQQQRLQQHTNNNRNYDDGIQITTDDIHPQAWGDGFPPGGHCSHVQTGSTRMSS